jgi:hypothetical protein
VYQLPHGTLRIQLMLLSSVAKSLQINIQLLVAAVIFGQSGKVPNAEQTSHDTD